MECSALFGVEDRTSIFEREDRSWKESFEDGVCFETGHVIRSSAPNNEEPPPSSIFGAKMGSKNAVVPALWYPMVTSHQLATEATVVRVIYRLSSVNQPRVEGRSRGPDRSSKSDRLECLNLSRHGKIWLRVCKRVGRRSTAGFSFFRPRWRWKRGASSIFWFRRLNMRDSSFFGVSESREQK